MKSWISILGIACVALFVVAWIVPSPKIPKSEKVEEWPMFRHDLANTGYTRAKGPEDNNVLWTFEVEFSILPFPPIVANGKVFVPEMGVVDNEGRRYNYLYCVDAEKGELIWKSEIGTTPSPPAVAGDKVYIGGGFDNTLWAFNAENGELIWNRVLPDTAYAAPTVVKNKVLYPTYQKLYCFNADNGDLIWESWAGSGGNSLAVGEDRIYGGDPFCSLNIENGDTLWSKTFWGTTTLYSVPVYARGVVYIATWKTAEWAESRLCALDAGTGEEIWSYLPGFSCSRKG